MGTSVNQGSPKTSGWKSVSVCYTFDNISIDRTATEIWRAAFRQDPALLKQLGSSLVADCMKTGGTISDPNVALAKVQELNLGRQNTVLGEFAKRALLIKASGGYQRESSISILFRQLTNYFVSRDLPGYVGPNFRCKTVHDLRVLKDKIQDTVARKVQMIEERERLSSKPWSEACPMVIEQLQKQ